MAQRYESRTAEDVFSTGKTGPSMDSMIDQLDETAPRTLLRTLVAQSQPARDAVRKADEQRQAVCNTSGLLKKHAWSISPTTAAMLGIYSTRSTRAAKAV